MLNLFEHQCRWVGMAPAKRRYYLAWKMGVGKTIAALAGVEADPMKTLVLAPLSTLNTAWAADAENFPATRLAVIRGKSKAARQRLIEEAWSVAVTNYDLFRAHAADFLAAGVRRLVIDEAVKVKNPKAQLTQAAIAFADKMQSVWLLSGFPDPNGPQDWWSQMRVCDKASVGPSFYAWANRWLIPQKRLVRSLGREVVTGWTLPESKRAAFNAALRSWVWPLDSSECLDLPGQTDLVREVELDEEAQHYIRAREELLLAVGDGEAPNRVKAEAALTKLRQIAGGGVLVEGEPHELGSSKLAELDAVLDELPHGEQAVVWCEFTHDVDRVAGHLSVRGTVARLDGRTSKDAQTIVGNFASGLTRFLVAHPAAAGHGTNGLQTRCSLAVFYGLSFNADQHAQARARIHRAGMRDRPAVYVYLLAMIGGKPSVDHVMLKALRRKEKSTWKDLLALRQEEAVGCP